MSPLDQVSRFATPFSDGGGPWLVAVVVSLLLVPVVAALAALWKRKLLAADPFRRLAAPAGPLTFAEPPASQATRAAIGRISDRRA